MRNVMVAGVGGQGTVLAAKVLAWAAAQQGRAVRSAETIGMSQRGGSVVSHVRMADAGERVHSSLVMRGRADLVIAFEPGEAARVLPYLAPGGTLVTATTPVAPVSASLAKVRYDARDIVEGIECAIAASPAHDGSRVVAIDDAQITAAVAAGRKALNSVMLAAATCLGCVPFTIEELKAAIASCVKPAYVKMNEEAVDATVRLMGLDATGDATCR